MKNEDNKMDNFYRNHSVGTFCSFMVWTSFDSVLDFEMEVQK